MNATKSISIHQVTSLLDRRRFFRLPWQLYRDDPSWVPPLRGQEKQLLGWRRHPFYDNARIATFYVRRGTQTLGRIAAVIDHAHNRTHQEHRGFFGFFECLDDQAAADSLFGAARKWLRERGMTTLRGPVNPSMNYTCGLLVQGFDGPPTFMMTYNPPYYAQLIERAGLSKAQDLYAFGGDISMLPPLIERYREPVLAALDRPSLKLRSLDRRRFTQDVRKFLDLYNHSLAGVWGFTPLSEMEVSHLAAGLKHLIVPEFTAAAEVDGEVVGAVFGLLDYNSVIRRIDGRLFPLGFLRLLCGRRHIRKIRILSANLLPSYQRSGLALLLLHHIMVPAQAAGIDAVEFSFVLESNALSIGSLRKGGAEIKRVYRIYDGTV